MTVPTKEAVMRRAVACASTALVLYAGCGGSESFTVPSDAEMATSVVSGAFNNSGGTAVGVIFVPRRTRLLDGLLE